MANKFDSVIERLKEANGGQEDALIKALMAKRDELGENAGEDEVEKAIKECLLRHLAKRANESDTEEDREFMENATGKVKELFSAEDWRYSERISRPNLVSYELRFGLKGCSLRMRVNVENNPKVCRIEAFLPISADATYDYVLCKQIAKENYARRFGALQYDENDGEVSYRYSFPITHGVNLDDLKHIFLSVATSGANCYEAVKKACVGKFKAKEINEILNKVNKLVVDLTEDDE